MSQLPPSSLALLSEDLYREDVHAISELLQNADDNSYAAGVEPKWTLHCAAGGRAALAGSRRPGRGGPRRAAAERALSSRSQPTRLPVDALPGTAGAEPADPRAAGPWHPGGRAAARAFS